MHSGTAFLPKIEAKIGSRGSRQQRRQLNYSCFALTSLSCYHAPAGGAPRLVAVQLQLFFVKIG
ncbi:hypothetical protein BDA96_07G086900 [Sorghum bicolor]|uniref:Uncharacterized protein n=1 Tax=Sorghum bicolor TaxID=4558 RepID=A0A921QLT7_SORBI|nr:hypothetical protein BDA96_07G086900 [Sorghum bicolor]